MPCAVRPPLAALTAALALALAPGSAAAAPREEEGPVELMDNSFLIEEAFNQEAGVVQNILTWSRDRASGSWVASFTQEWPVPDERNQLSYQLTYGKNADPGRGVGVGDLLINWRFRAADTGTVAFAPRLTLVVAAGKRNAEIGFGGYGPQVNLPVSTHLGPRLVTHSNLGATWIPSGRAGGQPASWVSYSLGQSFVWLVHPRLNLLAEVLWIGNERTAHGVTSRDQFMTVSPGVRAGVDLPGDVQVVVGAAVPLGIGPSAGDVAVLAYLSVEAPFWRPEAAPPAAAP